MTSASVPATRPSGQVADPSRSAKAREERTTRKDRTTGIVAVAIVVVLAAGGIGVISVESSKPHFVIGVNTVKVVGPDGKLVDKPLGRGQDRFILHMPGKTRLERTNAAIDGAFKISLPVYETVNGRIDHRLTAMEAHQLAGSTNTIGLMIPVYDGDQIDLRWGGSFTPAPGKPPASSR